jgi:hypothetical protein
VSSVAPCFLQEKQDEFVAPMSLFRGLFSFSPRFAYVETRKKRQSAETHASPIVTQIASYFRYSEEICLMDDDGELTI